LGLARILVVEDDPLLARLVTLVLTTEGHTVDAACNGLDALSALENQSFDAIILDLMMPEMDGRTFFHEARTKGYRTPVIVFSAFEPREAARELGAEGFVPKPFDPADLLAVVNKVLV
jgi:DNA-binding response OmpR family regulator